MKYDIHDNLSDLRPLFILGVPRSGTTFLQQIINTHPDIFISDELRVVAWLIKESKKIREGFTKHGNPYPFNLGEEFAKYLLGNAGSLLAPFYYINAPKYGKKNIKYWGDKYPHFNEVLPQMKEMFPRAKYIMIHRDLRDIMVSVQKGHNWGLERTMDYVCDIYKNYIVQIKNFSNETIFHVHYDNLSNNTQELAKKILDFLNLEYDDMLIMKMEKNALIQSHSVRKNKTTAVLFNKDNTLTKWKEFYNEEEYELICNKLESITQYIKIAESLYEK